MTDRDTGLTLLRVGLGVVAAFLLFVGGYLVWAAAANPDVRLKPQWLPDGQAFDHSYWIPVLVVTLGGAVLVGVVLWKAYRRVRSGEDLFEARSGKGVRRRGERHLGE